jgi:hypothetical protein
MSRKFQKGERVQFYRDGKWIKGKVTAVVGPSRRLLTDAGHSEKVAVARLTKAKDSVLLLETRLESSLTKPDRQYAELFSRALRANLVEIRHERVHTKNDLRHFLQEANRAKDIRFIHIIGHGREADEKSAARLCLTFEDVDLRKNANLFRGLPGRILIFSSCEIGRDRDALLGILQKSGAQCIYAYNQEVDDWYSIIVELLLYDRLINQPDWPPERVGREVQKALNQLGLKPDESRRWGSKSTALVWFTQRELKAEENHNGRERN